MSEALKAPFPWFGGKSRVAGLVWERFGDVPNYVEPFAGSLAVLLGRPSEPGIETINDKDCMVANFWRALKNDRAGVTEHADWPVNEADQHARHLWLCSQEEFRERMKTDPDYFDAKIAGWWVWGQCIWIGDGWCAVQRPHLGSAGTGVHRQRPHLGSAGTGVHRQLPHLGNDWEQEFIASDLAWETPEKEHLEKYLTTLSARLRSVRVCCGDWSRICGPTPTVKQGITGVFLDPPYSVDRHDCYAIETDCSAAVREWSIANGDNPLLRIALCGYEGEHEMPDSWDCVPWKARGGYGSQSDGRGRENSTKERIWFNPHCLHPSQFLIKEVMSA